VESANVPRSFQEGSLDGIWSYRSEHWKGLTAAVS
jgi:hypothetical protein